MDVTSNLERARKLTKDWPSWKREYRLTKNSEAKNSVQPAEPSPPRTSDTQTTVDTKT